MWAGRRAELANAAEATFSPRSVAIAVAAEYARLAGKT